MEPIKCTATTLKGTQCKKNATTGGNFCHLHGPKKDTKAKKPVKTEVPIFMFKTGKATAGGTKRVKKGEAIFIDHRKWLLRFNGGSVLEGEHYNLQYDPLCDPNPYFGKDKFQAHNNSLIFANKCILHDDGTLLKDVDGFSELTLNDNMKKWATMTFRDIIELEIIPLLYEHGIFYFFYIPSNTKPIKSIKLTSKETLKKLGITDKITWKKWMLKNHPDKLPPEKKTEAEKILQEVNHAMKDMGW